MSILFLALSILSVGPTANDREQAIDVQRSVLSIHVGKAGIFSAAGHEHWVDAPIAAGVVKLGESPRIRFVIRATNLTVRPDEPLSTKDLRQVQSNMQNQVLESSKYPEIEFESTHIEDEADVFKVSGNLTLHGVMRPVLINVKNKTASISVPPVLSKRTSTFDPYRLAGAL